MHKRLGASKVWRWVTYYLLLLGIHVWLWAGGFAYLRNSGQTEVGLENNNATFLEDAAQNADLYIANQNVSMQI